MEGAAVVDVELGGVVVAVGLVDIGTRTAIARCSVVVEFEFVAVAAGPVDTGTRTVIARCSINACGVEVCGVIKGVIVTIDPDATGNRTAITR